MGAIREQSDVQERGEDRMTSDHPQGEQLWEDWIDITMINGWNDEQKLIWLKVRLDGEGTAGTQ